MDLLQMSLSGAVLILCVMAIRVLTIHKLPKATFPVLWDIVLFRLLVPFSLPSEFGVCSLVDGDPFSPAALMTGPTAGPTVPPVGATLPGGHVWTAVWIAGALILLLFFSITYLRCRLMFRASLPVRHPFAEHWLTTCPIRRTVSIRQSACVSASLTYGLLRPVILMPSDTDWEDQTALRYVLAHESIHIRRFDAFTKLALTLALCIHWFDPLVWAMYVLADRDMELSCDEAVIRHMGIHTRAEYARTLISMEERKSGLYPLSSNFGKNAIEERIRAIMKTKRYSNSVKVFAALLILALLTVLAAFSPVRDSSTPIDTLADSLSHTGQAITFQIPSSLPAPEALEIHIAGRAQYENGFSQSLHFLEGENGHWIPGTTYSIPYDPAYTDLTMDIYYNDGDGDTIERNVDLLAVSQ